MNDKKLKLITPIFTNPVGWARWIGNSKLFVLGWFFAHVLFVIMGFGAMYSGLINAGFEHQRAIGILLLGFLPIVIVGIFFPTMYAYAIYRLLKIIDKEDEA